MKRKHLLRRLWAWLPPQTWPEVFGILFLLLVGFLALAYALDLLKGVLP